MKRKIPLLVFLSLAVCYQTGYSQKKNLELKEILVIGKEDSDSTEYLFSSIPFVHLNRDGNILVANSAGKTIRIFNRNGVFLKEFGRSGKGPGEFSELTSISNGENGQLIVVDRMQDRLSFFDKDGKFLRTELLPEKSLASLQFVYWREGSNDYLLTYRDYVTTEMNGSFLHLYDYSFESKKDDFLDLYEYFFDASIPIERRFSIVPRYYSTEFGNGKIALTPYIYTGTLAVVEKEKLTTALIGEPVQDFYKVLDFDKREKYRKSGETGIISSSGQTGRYLYKPKATNFGLVGNSNFLLQFYGLFEGKEVIPYLNIYSSEGELLSKVSLKNDPAGFIKEKKFSVTPHFLDEENNLYVYDYSYKYSFPVAIVFKTNLENFLNN